MNTHAVKNNRTERNRCGFLCYVKASVDESFYLCYYNKDRSYFFIKKQMRSFMSTKKMEKFICKDGSTFINKFYLY